MMARIPSFGTASIRRADDARAGDVLHAITAADVISF